MEDFPKTIADFLESTATRVRSLTVDRIARGATWGAVGLVLGALGTLILFFLIFGIFRILAEVLPDLGDLVTGETLAYALIGGLFLVGGAFLWSKRHHIEE